MIIQQIKISTCCYQQPAEKQVLWNMIPHKNNHKVFLMLSHSPQLCQPTCIGLSFIKFIKNNRDEYFEK